jgi:glycosyltransferase involved in cell wall biosynthesis
MQVSIIVPIYQVEDYLDETLQSISRIAGLEYEVLMIDDGSTDKSGEIAKGYAVAHENFIYRRTENQGVSAARNLGIAMANGEYIAFCDGDDILLKDGVLNLYNAAQAERADLAIGQIIEYNMTGFCRYAAGERLGKRRNIARKDLDLLWTFMISGKLYRREFLLENDLRFPPLKYAEDAVFFMKCVYHAKTITGYDGGVYGYRKRISAKELSATQICTNAMWSDFITAQRNVEKMYNEYLKPELTAVEQQEYEDELHFKIADSILNGFCRFHWTCNSDLRYEIWDNYYHYVELLSEARATKLKNKNIQTDEFSYSFNKIAIRIRLAIILSNEMFHNKISDDEKRRYLILLMNSIYEQKWIPFKVVIEKQLWQLIEADIQRPENIEIAESISYKSADYQTDFTLVLRKPVLIGTDALIHAFRFMQNNPDCKAVYACNISKKRLTSSLTEISSDKSMLSGRINCRIQSYLLPLFKGSASIVLVRKAGGSRTKVEPAFRVVKI